MSYMPAQAASISDKRYLNKSSALIKRLANGDPLSAKRKKLTPMQSINKQLEGYPRLGKSKKLVMV